MALRAHASKNYLTRLGIVGLFCLGGALWFLYDGLVTYPNQRIRAEDFAQFAEDHPEMEELERLNAWNVRAEEKGWPTGNPGEPFKDYDILGQFFYAGVAGLAALGFLSRVAYMFSRWIECDDQCLRDKSGRQAEYAQITELNKKKWQSKGIAHVHYQSNGRRERITLDDYYFERDTTRNILRQVEANIDPGLITNGKPEPLQNPVPPSTPAAV